MNERLLTVENPAPNCWPQSGTRPQPHAARPREKPTPYTARLATNPAEIRAAQALRFLVFNLELNEGLESSYHTCLDADPFDDVCDHLLVEDTATGEIVGTYRLQTGLRARSTLGFYSASLFDLAPVVPRARSMIELGRACVHRAHRNFAVLRLLWRGIAAYARDRQARWLLGCSSVHSQDPSVGAAVYRHLCERHLAPPEFRCGPLPDRACDLATVAAPNPSLPRLLGAYLALGATIAGPPAIDREFKTIDFLTVLDLEALSPRAVERYLV
jgi:putative hemolysin